MLPTWFTRQGIRRWMVSLLISAILTVAGYPILKKHVGFSRTGAITVSSDVLVYVDAARDLLDGKDIYNRPGEFPYVYPPFYAVINIPLVLVDPLVLDVVWYLLNVVLLCAILHMAFFLFTGTEFASLSLKDQWFYAGLSIVFAARYLIRNAHQANVNLFVLFLVILSLFLIRRTGKAHWASLVGIAAAIKVLPLIFLVYFLGGRRWKELGFVLLAFVGATFAPSLVLGFDKNWEYLQSFLAYVQGRLTPTGVAVENFSLWGTLGRVLSRQVAFTIPDENPTYVNIANLDLQVVKYMIYGMNCLLVALVYDVSRKARDLGGQAWRLSGGAIVVTLLTMNLASVLIEDHHTVGFLVAHLYLLIVWRTRMIAGGLWVALMFGAAIMSNLISYDTLVPIFGKHAYMTCLAFSLPVLPVAIILLSLTFRSIQLSGAKSTVRGELQESREIRFGRRCFLRARMEPLGRGEALKSGLLPNFVPPVCSVGGRRGPLPQLGPLRSPGTR